MEQRAECLSVRDAADITSKMFQIHVVVVEGTAGSEVRGQRSRLGEEGGGCGVQG